MKLCKERGKRVYKEQDFFATRSGQTINLSSAVRDAILPFRYVEISVANSKITIKPVNDDTEYKICLGGGRQAKLTYNRLEKLIEVPQGIRFPAERNEDGTITIQVGQEAVN